MASDVTPVQISAASLVHGSQANPAVNISRGGNSLPSSGKAAPAPAERHAAPRQPAVQQPVRQSTGTTTEELVAELNKHLNLSGRADQYRVDPSSSGNVIQQINPANGEVLGEFLVSQFPALARSLGISGGTFVDERA